MEKNKERYELYNKIVARAEELRGVKWKGLNRLSRIMDVEFADDMFHMRLQDWLDADDENFIHDWNGIQSHLDRTTQQFEGTFLPRFAS